MSTLRFVDMRVTVEKFAGSHEPYEQLAPVIDLRPGERIVGVDTSTVGTRLSHLEIWAMVWIETP